MFMGNPELDKKFNARVDNALWEQWEHWLDGRGRVTNKQLMSALLRLFLGAPELIQLKALFGRQDALSDREMAEALLARGVAEVAAARTAGSDETRVEGGEGDRGSQTGLGRKIHRAG